MASVSRLFLTTAACCVFAPQFAAAQSTLTIPSPREAQAAYFVADAARTSLPAGRTQTPTDETTTRSNGYAGDRPAAYTRPVGQQVYTSQAYPAAPTVPQAAPAAPTASRPPAAANAPTAQRGLRGLRVEVRTGWDHLPARDNDEREKTDSALYGLGVGVDRNFGHMFVGGYASIDWTGAAADGVVLTAGPTTSTEVAIEETIGRDVELGIRLGYWLGDHVNVYGLAAYSNVASDADIATVTITPADPVVPGSVETRSAAVLSSADSTYDGWRVGAGSEVLLARNIYGKAEYRYSSYSGDNDADFDRHQLMTGVGVRF